MSEDQAVFVRGNDRLARLLKDPQTAADVASAVEEIRAMDRAHAMSLAMIRKAGQLTQVEVAQRMGIGQGVVSRLENRDDMLLSTLFGYLAAVGADTARIIVTINGREVDLDLGTLARVRANAGPEDARQRVVTQPFGAEATRRVSQ
jgi:transcriptional regulator with XRE-family HTH domain